MAEPYSQPSHLESPAVAASEETQQIHKIGPSEALVEFLRSLLPLTGAQSASLLIYDSFRDPPVCGPFHCGSPPFLPEFVGDNPVSELINRCSSGTKTNPSPKLPTVQLTSSQVQPGRGYIICLGSGDGLPQDSIPYPDRRSPSKESNRQSELVIWIGLRYARDKQKSLLIESLRRGEGTATDPYGAVWSSLSLAARLAYDNHRAAAMIRDPVCGLPGRLEFQSCLQQRMEQEKVRQGGLGLILINPDDFALINQRFGQDQGDAALRQIAAKISHRLRRSDAVFRYGGAIFAVIMAGIDPATTRKVGEQLLNHLTGVYLDGAVKLSFSLGISTFDGQSDESIPDSVALLKRADHALSIAKLAGGGRSILWQKGETESALSFDRLSGIFTADSEKDYRNMLLLWDTISTISAHEDTRTLAKEFVERIASAFKARRVALFGHRQEEELGLIAASGQDEAMPGRGFSFRLSEQQKTLLSQAKKNQRIERVRWQSSTGAVQLAYAVPLTARNTHLGVLYLEGQEIGQALDSSDLMFLNALAKQVAVAIDRADLAARWKAQKQRESQQLKQEVQGLRQALQQAKLVYRSPQLQAVLETIKAVAATDVTVLITGESGTGKEMMARTLHECSNRREQPLVTVDCGAIAHNLMESELFGHTKGAFTGAHQASEGRILQAKNGTLFLDEIGELPLDVQAKLLRFVQEKEVTPVGGGRTQRVDVRIVAATNRDLAEEVEKGRFRQDLYYRLQVVTVKVPPLRDRPDDILPLARYFVEKFALQYGKGKRMLTPEVESKLLEYAWPGNVRELHNSLLRAVVMSKTEQIGCADLALLEEQGSEVANLISGSLRPAADDSLNGADGARQGLAPVSRTPTEEQEVGSDPWRSFRELTIELIESLLGQQPVSPVPLGRWLVEDLVILADNKNNQIARRACHNLGMAETTYRRHLEKISMEKQLGQLIRIPAWENLRPCLDELVETARDDSGVPVAEKARQILLEVILKRLSANASLGAKLMGVSLPTYRKAVAKVESQGAAESESKSPGLSQ